MRAASEIVETRVPARLDRLPWGRFHTLVVLALGITWALDGLEVTLAGSIAGALEASPRLRFTAPDVGLASSFYLAGAVLGAPGFGWLTDRLGRRLMFFVTLGLYLSATAATALSWNLESFCLFRFLTGAGIGGEYSAVNSTIQEMIPARYRGWTDLAIGGTFWIGSALGAAGSVAFLANFDPDIGWRLTFLIGAALGLIIFFLRTWLPESPRWLVIHGRAAEAESIVDTIETRFRLLGATLEDISALRPMSLRPRTHTPLRQVFQTLFIDFRIRTLVGLTLMIAQAFFYNAIFFTYALVLTNFYSVLPNQVGWYILPFSLGNVLGPLLLGPLFDSKSFGRKRMIAFTYTASGLLLAGSGCLFMEDFLDPAELTVAWTVVFFFASSAAGSAYLTVSEIFPVEIRALAIAFFYSAGTAIGGVVAPLLFGILIQTGSRVSVFGGYVLASGLMIVGAIIVLIWGVAAERKPLEEVARPLSSL